MLRLKNITDASKDSWQAAAWFLERKYPDEYGKKNKYTLSGSITLESVLDALPTELSAEIRKYLAEAVSKG